MYTLLRMYHISGSKYIFQVPEQMGPIWKKWTRLSGNHKEEQMLRSVQFN
jgi:hypothetical protein